MTTLEILDPAPATTEVAEYRATEAGLAALRERLAGKTYDLTTTAGDAEARADRRELVAMRTGIERIRKEAKAEAEARRAAAIEALFREMREIARQAVGKGSVVVMAKIRAEEERLAAVRAQAQAEHEAKMRAEREAAEAESSRLAAIAEEQERDAAEKRRLAHEAEMAREDACSAAVDDAVRIVRNLAVAAATDIGVLTSLIAEARQVVEVLGVDA